MLKRRPPVNVKRPADLEAQQPVSADSRLCRLAVGIERPLGPNPCARPGQIHEKIPQAVIGHVEISD